jgi:hypothetical protein
VVENRPADSKGVEWQGPRAKTNCVTFRRGGDQNWAMEQSIRKIRSDLGATTHLMLAVALVAACSVNAFLLLTHL